MTIPVALENLDGGNIKCRARIGGGHVGMFTIVPKFLRILLRMTTSTTVLVTMPDWKGIPCFDCKEVAELSLDPLNKEGDALRGKGHVKVLDGISARQRA